MEEALNGYFSSVFTREDICSLSIPNAKLQEPKSNYIVSHGGHRKQRNMVICQGRLA